MGNFDGNITSSAIEETLSKKSEGTFRKNEFDIKNYLNTKLKDGENERDIVIRILPVSADNSNFRVAVKTHNLKVSRRIASSGFKSFLCLNDPQVPGYDPNVKCPLCAKAQYYFDYAKDCRAEDEVKSKQAFMKACTLKSKTTYIVRVIERGKEDEGVKFWRFNENSKGQGIYDALISLYKQRKKDAEEEGINDYNIFSLDNGRDLVLHLTRTKTMNGKDGVAIQITDKSINKPLTTDIELGNKWINDTKMWYNAYVAKTTDYLSIVADDMIPYFDKSVGRFVAWTEDDFINMEQNKLDRQKEYAERQKENAAALESAAELLSETPHFEATINADDNISLPF